jgi:Tfp pilus assembly protein PilF
MGIILVYIGNMAILYADQHQLDSAVVELKRAISLHPNSAWAHSYLARVYEKLGRFGRPNLNTRKPSALKRIQTPNDE